MGGGLGLMPCLLTGSCRHATHTWHIAPSWLQPWPKMCRTEVPQRFQRPRHFTLLLLLWPIELCTGLNTAMSPRISWSSRVTMVLGHSGSMRKEGHLFCSGLPRCPLVSTGGTSARTGGGGESQPGHNLPLQRGGGGRNGLLRLTLPPTRIRKFFFEEKNKLYQRGPKLEVDFRDTNFFFCLQRQ